MFHNETFLLLIMYTNIVKFKLKNIMDKNNQTEHSEKFHHSLHKRKLIFLLVGIVLLILFFFFGIFVGRVSGYLRNSNFERNNMRGYSSRNGMMRNFRNSSNSRRIQLSDVQGVIQNISNNSITINNRSYSISTKTSIYNNGIRESLSNLSNLNTVNLIYSVDKSGLDIARFVIVIK